MYSTVRKLSILNVLLCMFNAIATVMLVTYLWGMVASFGLVFFGCIYLISSTIVLICATVSLRSLIRDLELEYESTALRIHDLSMRLQDLETKVK